MTNKKIKFFLDSIFKYLNLRKKSVNFQLNLYDFINEIYKMCHKYIICL